MGHMDFINDISEKILSNTLDVDAIYTIEAYINYKNNTGGAPNEKLDKKIRVLTNSIFLKLSESLINMYMTEVVTPEDVKNKTKVFMAIWDIMFYTVALKYEKMHYYLDKTSEEYFNSLRNMFLTRLIYGAVRVLHDIPEHELQKTIIDTVGEYNPNLVMDVTDKYMKVEYDDDYEEDDYLIT